MLATPTPALYMESLADAAKGKVKAAEREAEKKKEDKNTYKRNEERTSLAGPVMLRPNALARLQQCACAPLLRTGPPGCLQQRACARSLRATRACLLYTSPSPRDRQKSRMPSSA